MKITIVDFESSGLDPKKHEILEIGAVIFDDETFEILDTVDIKVKPLHPETGSPEAYKVNGYNEKDWEDAIPVEQALSILFTKARYTAFCANNVVFDWGFLSETANRLGKEIPFGYKRIDIYSMAWCKIPHEAMANWRLKSMCNYLGIEPEPAIHRGINGAMKEYEVYKKLMQMGL